MPLIRERHFREGVIEKSKFEIGYLIGSAMSSAYPIIILQDRYSGTYSNGKWIAIAVGNQMENGAYRIIRCLEDGPSGDDTDAQWFWSEPPDWVAVGDTPNEAEAALMKKLG